jgi:dolichyl-phosphate beta-glucosyltransferase
MTQSKKLAQSQPNLSLVIPAYSEERRIGKTLDELAHFLKSDTFFKTKNIEVIVVTADAPDKTQEIVASKQSSFKRYEHLKPGLHVGKGRDVQFGMQRATGQYIIYMDADLATPLHHLEEFYKACEQGSDIVVGTRDLFHYRSGVLRNMFSGIGNRLYQAASGIHLEDTQCGFKMFTNQAAQLCLSKLTIMGWDFDLEVLAIAKVNDLMVTSMKIDDWEDKPYSTYTDSALRITGRMIRDFMRITINRISGVYSIDK